MHSPVLRQLYCQARQVEIVSDSQWRRITSLLEVDRCDSSEASLRAKTLGQMRLSAPFARLSLSQVNAQIKLNALGGLGSSPVTGRELMAQAQKQCGVSARTVRRWGEAIGIPMKLNDPYTQDELRRWAEKMILCISN